MTADIIRTKDFNVEAAECISARIKESLIKNGSCVISLAGGKTPMSVYERLAQADLDWNKIYLTFGDERNVPSADDNSNYKNAFDSLISKIRIPQENVLRIRTELGFEQSAEQYEKDLLSLKVKLGHDYIFDVVLLGIGHDGHTASLFPGSPALEVADRLVAANKVNHANSERITLTFPAIAQSKEIIFLVNDHSKKEVLEKIWVGENFPAAKVSGMRKTTWIVSLPSSN